MINTKIPTFLGVAAITIGTVTGLLLVSEHQSLQTQGRSDNTPKNVRVSNVTDSSFTVSWTTDDVTTGFVNWGEKTSNIASVTQTDRRAIHSHTVTDLNPTQTYYFTLVSDGVMFDNNKIPWSVKTGATLPAPRNPYTITGTVVDTLGNPVEGALVSATVGGVYPLSTTTSPSGNWILSLGLVRTNDLLNYTKIKPETTLVELSVFGTANEPTLTKFYLESAASGVTVIIGKNGNTITSPANFNLIPTASLTFPDTSSEESGFGILLNDSN